MWVFHNLAGAVVWKSIVHLLPNSIPRYLVATVLAQVVIAPLTMGWTHIVISEPSSKYWFRRIPSVATWKKVAIPTLILSTVMAVGYGAPMYLSRSWNTKSTSDPSLWARKTIIIQVIGLAIAFFITLPARVSLARVNASVLSEEEETIVPFDRSFGGKFVPEIVGGSGVIGILDAWKTFSFQSRIRLVKLCVMVFVMECFVILMWAVVLTGFLFTQSELTASSAMTMAQNKFRRSF